MPEKSSGLPFKVMLIGTVWVPLLGGFWMNSWSVAADKV
jgi:hypothetical protein